MNGGNRMDNEGTIDQAEIDELLNVANKELFAPELELEKIADNKTNQLSTPQDNKVPLLLPKNKNLLSQILQQQQFRKIVVAVTLLFILAIVGGGFLGYEREQQTLSTPLPLEKIIQMGITFEAKNLVAYAGLGDKAIVTSFLDAGMEINAPRSTDGWTALTAASFYKKPELVQLLLERNATINIQDLYGRTPLMYAAAMGTEEIVTMLLEAGANPNIQDKKGRTALMEAYSKQEAKIAEILKDAGASTTPPPVPKLEESPTPPLKQLRKENAASPPESTIAKENRLTAGSAGLVQIGMPLEDLQELFPSLTLREEYINGNKIKTATIYLHDTATPSLKIELSSGKIPLVSAINIYDSSFMTDKNITLNSTVGDIRNQYSQSEVRVIDNSLFLVVKSMRMLFELDMKNAAIPVEWLKNGNINAIPSTTKITHMIMY
jgi:hypothetical protein